MLLIKRNMVLSAMLCMVCGSSFAALNKNGDINHRTELIVDTGRSTIHSFNRATAHFLEVAYATSSKEPIRLNEVEHFLFKMDPSLVPSESKKYPAAQKLLSLEEGLFTVFCNLVTECSNLGSTHPDLNGIFEAMKERLSTIAQALSGSAQVCQKQQIVKELLWFIEIKNLLLDLLDEALVDKKGINLNDAQKYPFCLQEGSKLKRYFSKVAADLKFNEKSLLEKYEKLRSKGLELHAKLFKNFESSIKTMHTVVSSLSPFTEAVVKNTPNQPLPSITKPFTDIAKKNNIENNPEFKGVLGRDSTFFDRVGLRRESSTQRAIENLFKPYKKGGNAITSRLAFPLLGGSAITSGIFLYSVWWLVSITQSVYSFLPRTWRIAALQDMIGGEWLWDKLDAWGFPAENILFFNPLKVVLEKVRHVVEDYSEHSLVSEKKETLPNQEKLDTYPHRIQYKSQGVIATVCRRVNYLNWLFGELLGHSNQVCMKAFLNKLKPEEKVALLSTVVRENREWIEHHKLHGKGNTLLVSEKLPLKYEENKEPCFWLDKRVVHKLVAQRDSVSSTEELNPAVGRWFAAKYDRIMPQEGNHIWKVGKENVAQNKKIARWFTRKVLMPARKEVLERFIVDELKRAEASPTNKQSVLNNVLGLILQKIEREEALLSDHWSYLTNLLQPWTFFSWKAKCNEIHRLRMLSLVIATRIKENEKSSIADVKKFLVDQIQQSNKELFKHQMSWGTYFAVLPLQFLNWFSYHSELEKGRTNAIHHLSLFKNCVRKVQPEPPALDRLAGLKIIQKRCATLYSSPKGSKLIA